MFSLKVEEKDVLMEALQQPWQVQEKAMETDVSALQWVEDLEQRVVSADLHLKVRNNPTFCCIDHSNDKTAAATQLSWQIESVATENDMHSYKIKLQWQMASLIWIQEMRCIIQTTRVAGIE